VDQRGAGGSNKLICPAAAEPAQQAKELERCLAGLDADPRAYTTAWAMDDVDDVRAALGYGQINLYGGSYGATAAQVYLLRHPEHVRTATLVAGTLLDIPIFEWMPASSQQALDALLARCAADTDCHAAYPDLPDELAGLLARLDQAPVELPLTDPATGQPATFTRQLADLGIHGLLVDTTRAARLPLLIHYAYQKEWEAVAAAIVSSSGASDDEDGWRLMPLTILCHEPWALLRPAETAAASEGSYLGYADVRAYTVPEDICAVMPSPPAAALYGPTMTTNVPVLLINGGADPQDPPQNVAAAHRLYPNSLSLIAPGQGHGSTGAACRARIVADFIERGSVEGVDANCLASVPLPAFELPPDDSG
jgi:pimeloyl-ACP methyl ester carboxylesterase